MKNDETRTIVGDCCHNSADKCKNQLFELIAKAQAGDDKALNTLLSAEEVKGVVNALVSQYKNLCGQSLQEEDLQSVGMTAAYECIMRFDPSKNAKLSTYVTANVSNTFKDTINKYQTSEISRNDHKMIPEIKRVKARLTQQLLREPSDSELAEELGMDRCTMVQLLKANEPIEIVLPTSNDDSDNHCDDDSIYGNYDPSNDYQNHYDAKHYLSQLEERDADIVRKYFGIDSDHDYSYHELAREYNMPVAYIEQIIEVCLESMHTCQ